MLTVCLESQSKLVLVQYAFVYAYISVGSKGTFGENLLVPSTPVVINPTDVSSDKSVDRKVSSAVRISLPYSLEAVNTRPLMKIGRIPTGPACMYRD